MVFIGEGGTGKSHVINAFRCFARGWGIEDKIRLSASSGVAAALIGGTTWHGLTKLTKQGKPHSKGKVIYDHIYMLIVDEISMLSLSHFGAGADNLQNLCARRGEPFGGLDVVLCGDFSQLEPVGNSVFDTPSINARGTTKRYELHGSFLWNNNVNAVVELVELKRCTDKALASILQALRTGVFSPSVFKLMSSRYYKNVDGVVPSLSPKHTCIYDTNKQVNEHNFIAPHLHAINTGERLFRITATSTDLSGQPLDPAVLSILYSKPVLFGEENAGPVPHIDFYMGMTVSVHQGNMCVETIGVGNGSHACIVGVLPKGALDPESCIELQVQLPVGCKHRTSKVLKPMSPITHLLLQLPLDAPKSFRYHGLPWNVYPLPLMKRKTSNFKHAQFPVRGQSACTPHKAQGLTLQKVAAAVTAAENKLYVAISRVRRVEDFVLLKQFTHEDAAKCRPNTKIIKVLQDMQGQ